MSGRSAKLSRKGLGTAALHTGQWLVCFSAARVLIASETVQSRL